MRIGGGNGGAHGQRAGACRSGRYDSWPSNSASEPARAAPMPTDQQGFAYSREQFQSLVEDVLRHAQRLGASEAAVEVSEGCGLSVSVRKGELENVERNRDKSLGVTLFV